IVRKQGQSTKSELNELESNISTYRNEVEKLKNAQIEAQKAFTALSGKANELNTAITKFEESRTSLDKVRGDLESAKERVRFLNLYKPEEWDAFRDRIQLLRLWSTADEFRKQLDDSVKKSSSVYDR